MIRRIYPDVTAEELGPLKQGITQIDHGTCIEQRQDDGKITLIAEFPGNPVTVNGTFPWMAIADQELSRGVREQRSNPRIEEYFATTSLGPQPDSVPWCSAFVNFCVVKSGLHGTNSALARSWAKWGADTTDFVPGCIVVLTRGSPGLGHVGFFAGLDQNGDMQLLGGNQRDSVNVSSFKEANVIARRVQAGTQVANLQPSSTAAGGFAFDSIEPERRAIAKHIVDTFALAGFGKIQQATALANAIAESGLDANSRRRTGREDSVGLFQLNRMGGLGTGHDAEELMDPDNNINIIIDVARRESEFRDASTLEAAISAFVHKIERPADPDGEIQKRLTIGEEILRT
jgi:uncharacterized protein (TIGR02594 family)